MFTKILSLREEYELTQEELGKILKVHRSAIAHWENGIAIIPIRKLNILANYFNVSFDYILGLSNKKNDYKYSSDVLDKQLVGDRIREVRSKNNLTLRDLAKELNTTSSTISAYESGKTLLLTAFAYEIAKRYKVSIDWLYGRK